VLGIPATLALSKAIQLLKGGSSKWIHETFPNMRGFEWQDGYAAFTVSKSNLQDVVEYVQNQKEHHGKKTYHEEYRAFVEKHAIGYDEKYLLG
jgi:putative transposase